MRAAEIHARLAGRWAHVLAQLGVPAEHLRKRAGPCPVCGGRDRFTFDDRRQRGDFFCRSCGAGDAFTLLQRLFGWSFGEAARQVRAVAGFGADAARATDHPSGAGRSTEPSIAQPTPRVLAVRRERCAVENCQAAAAYLASRALWPLPAGCTLRAHPGVDYWHEKRRLGRYAALVAEITDRAGELVSVHVTYLTREGQKLAEYEPRKILSRLAGREGCAVRLVPLEGAVLGVAEGIETALSAVKLHGIPVWAALNTSMLAKFEPPPEARELVLFADADAPGLTAAAQLMERLQGRVAFRLHAPSAPAKDWNDVLMAHERLHGGSRWQT